MRLFVVSIAFFVQTLAAQPARQVPIPPIQNDRFVRDLREKNIDDLLHLYTPRATFVDPDGHEFLGYDQLRRRFQQMSPASDRALHLETTSIKRTYTAVIEHGRFTETVRNPTTGATKEFRGSYVFLHEKQPNGDWLIAHQRWAGNPLR